MSPRRFSAPHVIPLPKCLIASIAVLQRILLENVQIGHLSSSSSSSEKLLPKLPVNRHCKKLTKDTRPACLGIIQREEPQPTQTSDHNAKAHRRRVRVLVQ